MTHRLSVSLMLAVGAAGAAGLAGCGGSSAAVAPVVRAAYTTTRAPGYRFTMTLAFGFGGRNTTAQATGSIDERDGLGAMKMNVGDQRIQMVIKKPYMYLAPAGSNLPGGKRWARMSTDVYTQGAGLESPTGDAIGAKQMLSSLRATGQVTNLGRQDVMGVATTHYRALVDFGRYAAMSAGLRRVAAQKYADFLRRATGSASLPIEVWIDTRQRVRRVATDIRICTPNGTLTESMTMDLYDFGRQPVVPPPPASEVADITGQIKAAIAQGLRQLGC